MNEGGVPDAEVGKISRRSFVKGAVVGAASLVGLQHEWNRAGEFASPKEASKEDIEQKYNVRLLGSLEAVGISERAREVTEENLDEIWDQDRLTMISQQLGALPAEFFHKQGEPPIAIALVGNDNDESNGDCNNCAGMGGTLDALNNTILLNSRYYHKYAGRKPLQALTHEFIHLTQSDKNWQQIPEISDAFGGDFDKKKAEIAEQLNSAQDKIFNETYFPTKFQDCLTLDMARNLSGAPMAGDQPTEFIAYLGQFYVFGQEQFRNSLTEIFGEETAEKLYQFTQNTIFFGKSYEKYPVDAYCQQEVTDSSTNEMHIEKYKVKDEDWEWKY